MLFPHQYPSDTTFRPFRHFLRAVPWDCAFATGLWTEPNVVVCAVPDNVAPQCSNVCNQLPVLHKINVL